MENKSIAEMQQDILSCIYTLAIESNDIETLARAAGAFAISCKKIDGGE